MASVTRLSWCVYFMTQKCQVSDINHLRYKLFCNKNLSGEKLPPTHDALTLHLSRVAFQVYIWMNAHKTSLKFTLNFWKTLFYLKIALDIRCCTCLVDMTCNWSLKRLTVKVCKISKPSVKTWKVTS